LITSLTLYPYATLYPYELGVSVETPRITYSAVFDPIFEQLVLKIISSDKSFLQIGGELVEFGHQKYRKTSYVKFII
jgi:hypothetical protein